MKNITLFAFIILLAISSSCGKDDDSDLIPKNDPTGDYLYSGQSQYFNSDGTLDFKGETSGSIYANIDIVGSNISIQILPSIGYQYNIRCTNLEHHGDTTTFRISRQQVTLLEETFSIEGTNNIQVGGYGLYDGYYTSKKIFFQYRSINSTTYDYSKTFIEATKRN
ncbi:MAG: hypothetical protein KAG64_07380 [Bacteroidales bacterium]|nr:hypothetical protein [Bacteroidales bacterium]